MDRRLKKILQPRFSRYFAVLIAFSAITATFNLYVAVAELILVGLLFYIFKAEQAKKNRDAARYIESITSEMDDATRNTIISFPLPLSVVRVTGEIVWCNDAFKGIAGESLDSAGQLISSVSPDLDLDKLARGGHSVLTKIKDRTYEVFANLMDPGDKRNANILITLYWVDMTEKDYWETRSNNREICCAIVLVDNFEEILQSADDDELAGILTSVEKRITDWASSKKGMIQKYEKDRYLCVFHKEAINEIIEDKFEIIDTMHQVVSGPNETPATVSIGVGFDGEDCIESFNFAKHAIDMALGRGGDQAVVKNRSGFEFFGGRSKDIDRRTKVKSRIMATAISELIENASNVLIMGHRQPDMDSLGAAVGIYRVCKNHGKEAWIVMGDCSQVKRLKEELDSLDDYKNAFISEQDAMIYIGRKTLLIIVDVNNPEFLESTSVYEAISQVVVIDHHRRAAKYVENAAINYQEPYASSACELVAELLQYMVDIRSIKSIEAVALLAGIALDTKFFTFKTSARTFDAASYLRRAGADTIEVKKLFQTGLDTYTEKLKIMKNAQIIEWGVAIAQCNEECSKTVAAQSADELLNIEGVQASFVIAENAKEIHISGRSLGKVNVQIILEKLGGGGHQTVAAAQLGNITMAEAKERLVTTLDEYFSETKKL